MSKTDRRFKNKYFCNKCRDRNYLVLCGCGCGGIMPARNKQYVLVKCIRGHNITPHIKVYSSEEEKRLVKNEKAKLHMREYRKTKKYRQIRDKYYNENKEKYSKQHKKFIDNNPDYPKQYRKNNREHLKSMAIMNRKRYHGRLLKYERNYRKEKPEVHRMAGKKHYWNHREQRLNNKKQWTIDNPDKAIRSRRIQSKKEIERGDNSKIRYKLIQLLGGKCIDCGYNKSIYALQIDHIYGKGKEQSQLFHGTQTMHRYYVNNPWKAFRELQCLCANCNQIKKHEMKENRRKPTYPCMRFLEDQ